MSLVPKATIAETAALIGARKLSPVDLVEAVLARIAEVEPLIHSYISVDADHARAAARHAESEIVAGRYRGPLHGIPYGLKDVIHVAGRVTSANSRALDGAAALVDAEAHRMLQAAGAILMGKLHTYEFGTGTGADLDCLPWPPARNPWNTSRFTGGSSTGSGAAVAAGTAMFALGVDTGGSVRLPAAGCGVVGLKPTYDLVSRAGVMPNCPSLDHIGPLTRTVADAALVMGALVPGFAEASPDGRPMRIGVIRRFHQRDVAPDADVDAAFEAAVGVLGRIGASISDIDVAVSQGAFVDCMRLINNAESLAVHRDIFMSNRAAMGPALFNKFMAGLCVPANLLDAARRWRERLGAAVDSMFSTCDAVICPTTPRGAPPLSDGAAVAAYTSDAATMPFSLSGVPAISVPMGFNRDGLPLGLQMAMRRGHDAALLRLAAAYQAATDWHTARPPLTARPSGGHAMVSPASIQADDAVVRQLLRAAGIASPTDRDLEMCSHQIPRVASMAAGMPDDLKPRCL